MPYFYKNNKVKRVKNSGWLLRNAAKVAELRISPGFPSHRSFREGLVVAEMQDGGIFVASFPNWAAMLDWLMRPSFFDMPLVMPFDGKQLRTRVGSFKYEILRQNPYAMA